LKNISIRLPLSNLILTVCFLIVATSCVDKKIKSYEKKDEVNLHETAKNHYELGASIKQQNPRKAIEEFKNAIRIDQLHLKAHLEYIHLMAEQGRSNQVINEYRAKIKQHPGNEIYHYLIGQVLEETEDKIEEYQKAIQINPDYYRAHLSLGNCYKVKGEIQKAVYHLKEVVRINPNHEETHRSLSEIVYGEQAKITEAIHHLKEVIRINPKDASSYVNLGVAYSEQGRIEKAIEMYEQAIGINPNLFEAHVNLGLVYSRHGELDKAIKVYQEVIRINPNDEYGRYDLGTFHQQQGNPDQAIHHMREVIRINPDFLQAHYNLGSIYSKQGNPDQAIHPGPGYSSHARGYSRQPEL